MRAGKRTSHQMLCRRLIDYVVLEDLLVVATPPLSQLCLTNMIVQIAVVMVTNRAAPVNRLPWTSPLIASYRSLMCGVVPHQNVHTLTRDATLATATEACWTTFIRYLPAVTDTRYRIPLTRLALHIATLHARPHRPTCTHSHRPRAHTPHRLTNLPWHLPPSRLNLQAS